MNIPKFLYPLLFISLFSTFGCAKKSGEEDDSSHLQSYELRNIHIKESDINEWCGERANRISEPMPYWVLGAFLLIVAFLSALGARSKKSFFGRLFVGVFVSSLLMGAVVWSFYPGVTLAGLKDDVKKFNVLVKNIDLLDQLQKAGNDVELKDRKAVLEAMNTTRSNLKTALQTERIFRENPDFRPEMLQEEFGLTSIASIELEKQSGELANTLNTTLSIQRSVQQKLGTLLGNDADLIPIE